ncbi:sigma factor-like helix-turn-helix DNA-binding protein [Streptomyces sp. NPDC052043]|uniref:sigma factor-like helix-turn-helix DNA-binding protein n=1 Tax=Streptomyces sp. NPDC052043 TaxID=3365684 RepID=UPI0037D2FB53
MSRDRAGAADAELAAVLSLFQRLSPVERVVFVLREVFRCGYPEIASALGRTEEACRRLAGADGRTESPPWPRRIVGVENVARALATIVPPLVRLGVTLEPREVEGRPGAVFRDRNGKVLHAVVVLDIADGRIQTIHLRCRRDRGGPSN